METVHEQKRRFQPSSREDEVGAKDNPRCMSSDTAYGCVFPDKPLWALPSPIPASLNLWLAVCYLCQNIVQKLRLVILARPFRTPAH